MKNSWQTTSLGEVTEVIAGQSPVSKFYNKEGNGLPFYQGKKQFSKKYIAKPDTWTTKVTKKAFTDDILMSVRAPVGPINFSTEEICIGRGLAAIRANKGLNKEYLFYYLLKHESEIIGNSGAVFNSINKKQIEQIPIPIPPVTEQEAIVEVLDKAFAAIDQAKANIEQNIANAKELFQSKLNQIFSQKGEGWVKEQVSNVAQHRLGKMLDKRKNTGIPKPYLRNKNVRWFECEVDDLLEMPFEENEYDKYTVHKGDVIICEGGYPGRAAIWNSDEPIYFQKAIHRVRFHEPSLNEWFVYYLWNMDFKNELKNYFTGAGIQHFTGKSLAKFPVPIGPLKLMKQQLAQLSKLHSKTENIVNSYQTKLTSLDELKKSILQKAFTGELTSDNG